ncbi:hypothetical protein [Streptomyces sp. G-G2]|uniref:hypothetical protein n=1 Tax=Streptomyces sp. G-G2 TaxID=3046201 RepID=UPI0024BB2961|nr:hypothetical protein [Streptomyces sp. G-G2]MDJ0385665.1 hypothetical protein [Streptomyces sp. G-G2]
MSVRGGVVRSVVALGVSLTLALTLGLSLGAAPAGAVGTPGTAGSAGVPGTGPWSAGQPGAAGPAGEPEADLAYHGRVSLSGGRLAVWVVPQNLGPTPLANTTLRLRLSADLADRQELAEGCARAGQREVMCETGALPARGQGRHIGLRLLLKEPEPEVVLRVDTWWNGGATDRDHTNDQHAVLALDTGDTYSF